MNHNIVCIQQSVTENKQQECLDLVMALASLDYHIHLVFYGDAVSTLFNTNAETIYHKRLQALPLFDVNDIWVDESSLNARQLQVSQLPKIVKLLPATQLKALLHTSLAVYTI